MCRLLQSDTGTPVEIQKDDMFSTNDLFVVYDLRHSLSSLIVSPEHLFTLPSTGCHLPESLKD